MSDKLYAIDYDPTDLPDDDDGLESEGDETHDENGLYRNCGMLRDGTCILAGSEECDWECGGLDE